jgi:hypothetical protein
MKKAAIALALLTAGVVAGCGGSGGTTTVIEKQAAVQPTVTVQQQAPAADESSATKDVSASGGSSSRAQRSVPDLVGQRLDVAEDKLDQLGLNYKEVGGGTFGIVVRSNWTVCQTEPASGGQAARIRLIVDREC